MRVLIFGASGDIGHHIRQQAREAGHELVLFARDVYRLEPLHEGERVVTGDIGNPNDVAVAVANVDAVISAVGPTSNTADQVTLFESFARSLVTAMEAGGVKRLVTLSGAGVTLPSEKKGIRGRIASRVVRLFVPHVVEAKQRELEIVINSNLEWIAPRPPRVSEGKGSGEYRVGSEAGMRISQGDLADFMVRALNDDTYLRQAPFVSN